MKNALIIPEEVVMQKIYLFRNQRVILDSDLATWYEVETRVLNQQINRNKDRFPKDFMFQLNAKEFDKLQVLQGQNSRGGRRTPPYVFTEHGVLMLSSILNSEKAVEVNIQLVRIFVKMRELILTNQELISELENVKLKLEGHEGQINALQAYLMQFLERQSKPKPRNPIGFKTKAQSTKAKLKNEK